MHVLAIESGAIDTGDEAVDLGQSPADIVVLSSADSELSLLANAYGAWSESRTSRGRAPPSLRLANLLKLKHNYSVDLYVEATLQHARLIVVRLLGGRGYWPYGVERLLDLRGGGAQIAILPGDDKADASLSDLSSLALPRLTHLWRCLAEGGPENAQLFLDGLDAALTDAPIPTAPSPIPRAGPLALPRRTPGAGQPKMGRAALIFYRALHQSGDLAPVTALTDALGERGLDVQPYFIASLRDDASAEMLKAAFVEAPPDIILNTTAFASGTTTTPIGNPIAATVCGSDAPWLQVVLSGQDRVTWEAETAGLAMRDIAMHVSLPEMDGRILTRAVAFKSGDGIDPATELAVTRSEPEPDRIAAVADLAAAWVRLRKTRPDARRIGIVLANYPNRDSRLANGVGLATPESVVHALAALEDAGYSVAGRPADDDALMTLLRDGPTNALASGARDGHHRLSLDDYKRWFATLPTSAQTEVLERWGPPDTDPSVCDDAFVIAAHRFGNLAVAVQPARGYNVSPKDTYHDPALVPPHGYLAFYRWFATVFNAHALIHFGKHGNLEWLPGKALALSNTCWPDIALGHRPNLYPFIVNDPGEGAQAKRRTAAVILDHLTPPLARAETYGPLKDLEALLDEYYEAQAVDTRRAAKLADAIVADAGRAGLTADSGIQPDDPDPVRLQKLDAYLCDLKELQIRSGLHVFGRAPENQARTELLSALARVPRGDQPEDISLQRALATDLGLNGFDPLDAPLAEPWEGPKPVLLNDISTDPWRKTGDTIERIELLAEALIDGRIKREDLGTARMTGAVLAEIERRLAPALDSAGACETAALLRALEGRMIAPGPAGAPTRGRWDTLPTGRNFYSLDSRALPTPTAWEIGCKSADALIARYVQDHGAWPRALVMSAWGTSNMRTGGDDLAQMLALIGARPVWEGASRRVTGYEILTPAQLGRPRVDVTLRISGFFRDAFPAQIALIDSAVRAIAARDETDEDNPIRANALATLRSGRPTANADARWRRATFRVFGSKPGAYGAGLQALFDERIWDTEADLADAFLTWGQYAYGSDTHGAAERGLIEHRLRDADAVLHNQDNREHDILDSDDYYQFAGGLAVTARVLKDGDAVPVYHGDTARPEKPVVRALDEEIARIVRGRAVNPKWIGAMMRHGYKGAFEMLATVDYLFAFAATTRAVRDHHFDAVYDAYLADPEVLAFLDDKNPDALSDIAAKLDEAIERGLWQPRSNSAGDRVKKLARTMTKGDRSDGDAT